MDVINCMITIATFPEHNEKRLFRSRAIYSIGHIVDQFQFQQLHFFMVTNYENLRIFGCPTYATISLDTSSTLEHRAIRTIFVVYKVY